MSKSEEVTTSLNESTLSSNHTDPNLTSPSSRTVVTASSSIESHHNKEEDHEEDKKQHVPPLSKLNDGPNRINNYDLEKNTVANDDVIHNSKDITDSKLEKQYTLASTSISTPKIRKVDWKIIPIPPYLRHDPSSKSFHFTLGLNVIFALTSTASIVQLYISTPILTRLSTYFEIPYDTVVDVVTLTQVGYLTGLIFLCPLGDLVRRRQLILSLLFCATSFTIGLCVTKSWVTFQALSYLTGMVSVMPQIMLPFAGDLAPNHRRASALSICVSGLLLGQVVARVFSGVVSQEVGNWRVVYYFGLAIQVVAFLVLYFKLPDLPPRNPNMTYPGILFSMLKLLVTKPVVIQSGLIGGISSAGQMGFWVSLTFVLTDIYGFNTTQIGLMGLIGCTGVILSPFIGKLVDRIVPWYGALLGMIIMFMAWSIYTGAAGLSYGALIAVAIMLDPAQQLQNVSNLARVAAVDPAARSRLNSIQIIFIFFGQLIASSVHSRLFLRYGVRAVGAFSLAMTFFATFVLFCRGPHETSWIGWKGGWSISKGVVRKYPQLQNQGIQPLSAPKSKNNQEPEHEPKTPA